MAEQAADYAKLSLEGWERLGAFIRSEEARVSGPAGDHIGAELSEFPAKQLIAWREQIDTHREELVAEVQNRDRALRSVIHQINRALGKRD